MRWSPFLALILVASSCAAPHPGGNVWSEPELSPAPLELGEPPKPSGPLKITILDVGQGDATLIQTPGGKILLIDGGGDGRGNEVILPFLRSRDINFLDAIVATHYDADHIAGLEETVAGNDGMLKNEDDLIPRSGVFDRGGVPSDSSPFYPVYAGAMEGLRNTLRVGDEIRLDESLILRCVAVNGEIWKGEAVDLTQPFLSSPENSSSIALLIEYEDFRYLTAGDLTGGGSPGGFQTADVESVLAAQIGPVSAVHVNHHGSLTSSNESFVNTLKPQAAFISVGDLNDYGHPAQEVLERWRDAGTDLWLTEKGSGGFVAGEHVVNGNIEIETDGKNWSVNGQSIQPF